MHPHVQHATRGSCTSWQARSSAGRGSFISRASERTQAAVARQRPPHGHWRSRRATTRPPAAAGLISQQAAWARGFAAAPQAPARRIPIVAAVLPSTRRRVLGAGPSGGAADGVEPVGMSTLPPLVTVSAVTFARTRKVARNVFL